MFRREQNKKQVGNVFFLFLGGGTLPVQLPTNGTLPINYIQEGPSLPNHPQVGPSLPTTY